VCSWRPEARIRSEDLITRAWPFINGVRLTRVPREDADAPK
jgi:hypothetical protein